MTVGIPIDEETRERLKRYAKEGETWDDLLRRLLSEVLPRRPAGSEELEKRRKEGNYLPLDEALEELESYEDWNLSTGENFFQN